MSQYLKQGGTPPANSVTTAMLKDNNVTGAKIAMGSDAAGDILYYNGTDYVRLAKGTTGHFLSQGGSNAPAWAEAGGGAWNLIGTSEASSSASLTITGINSTYDTYGVAVSSLIPATNNVDFYLRVGDSSGIDSGGSDYAYHASGGRAGASTARTAFSDSAAQIALKLTGDGIQNSATSAGSGFGMMAFLHNPSDSAVVTSLSGTYWYIATSLNGDGGSFGANRSAVIAHDRIQVFFSSGDIASGRLSVWGIAHA
jgi:hypothetical protein